VHTLFGRLYTRFPVSSAGSAPFALTSCDVALLYTLRCGILDCWSAVTCDRVPRSTVLEDGPVGSVEPPTCEATDCSGMSCSHGPAGPCCFPPSAQRAARQQRHSMLVGGHSVHQRVQSTCTMSRLIWTRQRMPLHCATARGIPRSWMQQEPWGGSGPQPESSPGEGEGCQRWKLNPAPRHRGGGDEGGGKQRTARPAAVRERGAEGAVAGPPRRDLEPIAVPPRLSEGGRELRTHRMVELKEGWAGRGVVGGFEGA